ncbi:MAG TPA: amino acid ABC transporter permease [Casimicrobiaceae bacterium]|nr:amino acid ABC transporter permease [Casimicrobiaceae bacterium]
MHYAFHFNVVWDHWHDLAEGAWLTVRLSALAMVIGLVVATACAYAKAAGPSPLRWTIAAYVEAIRNTPFLVQIFIIYFSLPALGISVGANEAALAAMVVNFGAYGTEILRAGIESITHGQIDAARALGLTRLQTFRYVILFPALKTVFPALASQFILLMLASSVVSAISAVELTAVTNSLQSTTFRPFEFYFVVTGIYLLMALGFRAVFGGIYWIVFMRRQRS